MKKVQKFKISPSRLFSLRNCNIFRKYFSIFYIYLICTGSSSPSESNIVIIDLSFLYKYFKPTDIAFGSPNFFNLKIFIDFIFLLLNFISRIIDEQSSIIKKFTFFYFLKLFIKTSINFRRFPIII